MNYYLGLDLGTSVLKATIIDDEGQILGNVAEEIYIKSSKTEYAEESTEEWWSTFQRLLRQLRPSVDFNRIKGIGLSGQMHGLVCYDNKYNVIRPAIIWADKRSHQEVETILDNISSEEFYKLTGNPVFTGFLLPSLLWIKNHEKETYQKIMKVSSPKDFIAFKLTSHLKSEPTDALATGCFDYHTNKWSDHILKNTGIDLRLFPEIIPTSTPYGTVTKEIADLTGLPAGIPVYGGSDQSMAAMGCGLTEKGQSLLAISTGGQFLVIAKKGLIDSKRRLHTLNHGIEGIGVYMAATLAAGLSLKWFKTNIMQQIDTSYDTFIKGIDNIPPGSDGLIYLPYLAGERTPYFNPNLKGAFIGQSLIHNRLHFIRAIMEGVAFSFKEGLNSFKEMNIPINSIVLSGGGTKNTTWRKIITDVIGIPTQMINIEDHSPFGAAVYAKFAQEGFEKLPEFYNKVIISSNRMTPIKTNADKYNEYFDEYKKHAAYLNAAFNN